MEAAQPWHGKHSSTACVHAWWATTQKHSTKHNGSNMQAMCAHHVSQGSGDRNTRATLVATHAKVHASPEFMFPQSSCFPRVHMFPQGSCFPRVHVSPEFMLPQSSCVPRVHASPEFVQKVHASPEFMLPQGGVRFATVVASASAPTTPLTFFCANGLC